MGRQQANLDLGALYRILASTPQNYHGHEKQGKTEKLSHSREGRENMTTKCNGIAWIRSWKTMEKLMKSKYSLELIVKKKNYYYYYSNLKVLHNVHGILCLIQPCNLSLFFAIIM